MTFIVDTMNRRVAEIDQGAGTLLGNDEHDTFDDFMQRALEAKAEGRPSFFFHGLPYFFGEEEQNNDD